MAVLGLLAACSEKEDLEREVPVTAIDLNWEKITLETGDSEELPVKVTPANATGPALTWVSSNPEVAEVSEGMVVARGPGKTEITVSSGALTDKCTVKVILPVLQQPVDLGLSVRWASCNVGAEKPEDYGDYFAWGETEPHYYSRDPLRWRTSDGYTWDSYAWWNSAFGKLTKYCPTGLNYYWFSNDETDGKTKLDREDDAARDNLGRRWRTPTYTEWMELKTDCIWEEWTTGNGIYGRKVTSKKNGNSIFLPAAGCANNKSISGMGGSGWYMSSSVYADSPFYTWYLFFITSEGVNVYSTHRYYGFSVRPVFVL